LVKKEKKEAQRGRREGWNTVLAEGNGMLRGEGTRGDGF